MAETALAKRGEAQIALPEGAVLHDNGLELPLHLPFDALEAVSAEAERRGLEAVEKDGVVYLLNEEGEVVGERDPDCWTKVVRSIFDRVEWLAGETSAVQLQLGDAINYGDTEYGERYAQWIDQEGYAYGSLANIAWVAREVPRELRLPGLCYYHYQQVAPLDDDDEKCYWLNKALEDGLSGRQLNDKITRATLTAQGVDPDLHEAEKGVGRAVDALSDLHPSRWADVVWARFLRPLRHLTGEGEWMEFLERLKKYLEGGA